MKDAQKKSLFLLVVVTLLLVTLVAGTLPSYAHAGPPPYRAVALITVPGWTDQQCFDIAFAGGHQFYLADATTKSVDLISTTSNRFMGRLGRGVFVGPAGCAQGDFTALGPDGVLATTTELYAGDGNGSVKVFDLRSYHLVATIKTGGKKRADEMAYDPQDNIVAVTSPNETPPFISFINTRTHRLQGRLDFPNAPQGLEQPAWDPTTDTFYLSIPQAILPAASQGQALDPSGAVAAFHYSATTSPHIRYIKVPGCEPAGLALNARTETLAVGCATGEQALLSTRGTILARIPISGVDMVTYNAITQHFFFAADGCVAIVDHTGQIVQRIPTVAGSHSVAVDARTGHVFVPENGLGIVVYVQKPA